jgi:hypothetical protein
MPYLLEYLMIACGLALAIGGPILERRASWGSGRMGLAILLVLAGLGILAVAIVRLYIKITFSTG